MYSDSAIQSIPSYSYCIAWSLRTFRPLFKFKGKSLSFSALRQGPVDFCFKLGSVCLFECIAGIVLAEVLPAKVANLKKKKKSNKKKILWLQYFKLCFSAASPEEQEQARWGCLRAWKCVCVCALFRLYIYVHGIFNVCCDKSIDDDGIGWSFLFSLLLFRLLPHLPLLLLLSSSFSSILLLFFFSSSSIPTFPLPLLIFPSSSS